MHHLDDLFWVEPSWLLRNLLLHQRALKELADAHACAPLVSREELELVIGSSARSQSHPGRSSHVEHQPEPEPEPKPEPEAEAEDEAESEADETDSIDAPRQASRDHVLPPHLVAPYIRLLER